MFGSTKIIKEISKEEFRDLTERYKNKITTGEHITDHLTNAQRKLFKEEAILDIVRKERPYGIGLQANGRLSPFYRRKWGFIRIIIEVKEDMLEIVTFTNPPTMPNLKRLGK